MTCPFLPGDLEVMRDDAPQLLLNVVHPAQRRIFFLGFVQAHGPMIPCVEGQMPLVADLIQARAAATRAKPACPFHAGSTCLIAGSSPTPEVAHFLAWTLWAEIIVAHDQAACLLTPEETLQGIAERCRRRSRCGPPSRRSMNSNRRQFTHVKRHALMARICPTSAHACKATAFLSKSAVRDPQPWLKALGT